MCQLLIGLDVLHTSDVVHRDLTLANVLVDGETWDTHIADFGLSRARESADKEISLDVVTLPYRAPELLLEYTKYDNTIDIWAFGCIMAEAFLQAPFLYVDQTKSNPDSFKQLKQVLKFTGFPDVERVASMASLANTNFLRNWATQLGDRAPRGRDIGDLLRERRPGLAISEEAVEVLRDALQFEPSRRLPAKELLAKPWFRNNADCAGLIDMCLNLPQPGPCPTQVEHMDRDQLRAFLRDQSLGRRANVDSYVAELSK
jgi:serine/threonine protein kinase